MHPGLLNVLQGKGVVEAQLGLGHLRMEAVNSPGAREAGAIGRQHWVGAGECPGCCQGWGGGRHCPVHLGLLSRLAPGVPVSGRLAP